MPRPSRLTDETEDVTPGNPAVSASVQQPPIDRGSVPLARAGAATDGGILLFDGTCGLCDGTVQFLIAHDSRRFLRFAPLQSAAGQRLLAEHGLPITDDPDSMVYIESGRAFTRSAAALAVARRLDGAWPLLGMFRVVPAFLRDAVYRMIARNRYRWFPRLETCRIPDASQRDRFLG